MCLGVPGRIIEVHDDYTATVDFWGIRRKVRLEVIDERVEPGDYILNHVGYAIRRIPNESIEETLSLYETLLAETGDDPMAADIASEISATTE